MQLLMWGALAATILTSLALYFVGRADTPGSHPLPKYGEVPAFSFDESRGGTYGLDDMRGEINVVDFIFTSCKGACPIMANKMQELYRLYAGTDLVNLVSISVDPDVDSLHVLRDYAEGLGVTDKTWRFLRGDIDDVKVLAREGFHVSDDFPGMHSPKLILVDRVGQIRGYYDSFGDEGITDLKIAIKDLIMAKK